jgi:hypothetical protein
VSLRSILQAAAGVHGGGDAADAAFAAKVEGALNTIIDSTAAAVLLKALTGGGSHKIDVGVGAYSDTEKAAAVAAFAETCAAATAAALVDEKKQQERDERLQALQVQREEETAAAAAAADEWSVLDLSHLAKACKKVMAGHPQRW